MSSVPGVHRGCIRATARTSMSLVPRLYTRYGRQSISSEPGVYKLRLSTSYGEAVYEFGTSDICSVPSLSSKWISCEGLRFRFRVQGPDLGFRIWYFGFRAPNSEFRV